jgi:aminoglycoside phosphotransferase (APT) family kinase protein
LRSIFNRFDTRSDFRSAEPFGTGHINDTFKVVASHGGPTVFFTLQHINTRVFRDPAALMSNITGITRHARRRLERECAEDPSRRAIQLVPTCEGGCYHTDESGLCWRMYVYVDGVHTVDRVNRPSDAYEAARAFARFQRLLADLPGARLNETIPGFHDTRRRVAALKQAVREDTHGRAREVRAEIDFALAHEGWAGVLLDLCARKEIPERVTHNDTKINNVLIDLATGEGICVIDLDTCMPGLALYDFGDMVRAATNSAAEDERDSAVVHSRREIFEALARGYVEAADFLVPAERAHLAFSGKLMTFECGVRFLTDYLQGDVYFRIHRPDQNLSRCRNQFALARSIEKQEGDFQRFVDGLAV